MDVETQRQRLQRACSAVGLSPNGSVATLVQRLVDGPPGRPGRKPKIANVDNDSPSRDIDPEEAKFFTDQRRYFAAAGTTNFAEQTQIIRRMWKNYQVVQKKQGTETPESDGEYTFAVPWSMEDMNKLDLQLVRVDASPDSTPAFVYRKRKTATPSK